MSVHHDEACLDQVLERITNLSQQIQQAAVLDVVLDTAVIETRQILKSDRVLIYRFLPSGDGVVISEAVGSEWQPIQGQLIYDPCFETKWNVPYYQGHISAITDTEKANLAPCYLQLLTRLQVRANLVVPVLLQPEDQQRSPVLWGLLIAHHCRSPYEWQPLDIQVLRHTAMQLGYRIQTLDRHQPVSWQNEPPRLLLEQSRSERTAATVPANPQNNPPIDLTDRDDGKAVSIKAFDWLQNPVWVFDIQRFQMQWANRASLRLWGAASRDELLNRDFSDVSESTRIRLQTYLEQFERGKTLVEQWTFYPEGRPISVLCHCSGIVIEPGRLAMLVEGTVETIHSIEQETLRSIEALRHTSVMISLYTLEGVPLLQNPAAHRCYGDTLHPNLGRENTFLRHFVDPEVRQQARQALEANEVFSIEAEVYTLEGTRWHGLDAWLTKDPATGQTMVLVNEKDITQQRTALQKHIEAEITLQREAQRLAAMIETQQAVASNNPNLNAVMALIVDQTRELTQASGAVIEMLAGNELVYQAANGIASEFLGLRLPVTGSLSGQCIATGKILQCDDSEMASHIDCATCQQLGLRSMVVVPLLHQKEPIGVLKILSTAPAAFTEQDVWMLQLMAGFLGTTIRDAAEFESKNVLLKALQESEECYRSVVTVLSEGVVFQQADGQITACNSSAEQILGLTQDQMIGRTSLDPCWQAIHEDGSPFPGETHPAMVTLRTGEPQSNVVMGVHKPDGHLTWISINSQPLLYPGQSHPYAVVTSFVDMTAQKQAEASLRHQAERERMIYTIAQHIRQSLDLDDILNTTVTDVRHFLQTDRVIVYRFNPDWSGIVVTESVAPAWSSILNMEIKDTYFVENHAQAYANRTIQATDNIYTAGLSQCHIELLETLQVQAKLVVPIWQGETLWGLLVAHQCHSPRHWQNLERELLLQLATQVAIAIQQSELYRQVQHLNTHLERQVEERTSQLQQALNFEALLKRITDSVRDSLDEQQILRSAVQELARGLATICCDTGIYNTDQTTSTIAYESSHALSSAQGKTFTIASSPHPEVYQSLLKGQVCQFCDVAPNPLRSDQQLLAVLACPLMDDQGVLGDLWLFKPSEELFDDQEVRLVQQVANQCAIALRQSRLYRAAQAQVEELARLNQLKDDFLSTVSHELRTPMSSMKTAIQMLEICLRPLGVFELETDPISCYFQILQTECQREISLINDLLDLTRIDSGSEPLNLSPIHLQFWISHVAEPFVQRTYHQEQSLEILVPDNLPPFTTDLSYLERTLTELLHNAFKYTPPGETITVSARIAEGNMSGNVPLLLIGVSNSGVEIPEVECDRIFDKFYRIPNHDPWKHGGTGLGLALVKKLVELLGGTIRVESGNQRTEFILQFPLVQ